MMLHTYTVALLGFRPDMNIQNLQIVQWRFSYDLAPPIFACLYLQWLQQNKRAETDEKQQSYAFFSPIQSYLDKNCCVVMKVQYYTIISGSWMTGM